MSTRQQFRNAMVEECGCSVCEAIARGKTKAEAFAELADREQRHLHEYGWYAHYVMNDHFDAPAGMNNCHTHGLVHSFNHPDFQIVIPIPPQKINDIFYTLVDLIKEGRRFQSGERSSEAINGYDVAFAKATEKGRNILRVILPAADGILDRDKMTDGWELQWEGTK